MKEKIRSTGRLKHALNPIALAIVSPMQDEAALVDELIQLATLNEAHLISLYQSKLLPLSIIKKILNAIAGLKKKNFSSFSFLVNCLLASSFEKFWKLLFWIGTLFWKGTLLLTEKVIDSKEYKLVSWNWNNYKIYGIAVNCDRNKDIHNIKNILFNFFKLHNPRDYKIYQDYTPIINFIFDNKVNFYYQKYSYYLLSHIYHISLIFDKNYESELRYNWKNNNIWNNHNFILNN